MKNWNKASYKGKRFWSGCVNLLDGKIEEVHTYEEAKAYDFHHSLYFTEKCIEGMSNGDMSFFCIGINGEIQGDWRMSISKEILAIIEEQLDASLLEGIEEDLDL